MRLVAQKPKPSWPRRLACWIGLHSWRVEPKKIVLPSGRRRNRRQCVHCGATQIQNAMGQWIDWK